jgi:phosphomannomutase
MKLTVFEAGVEVFIGGDNRPSTRELMDLVTEGVKSQNGEVIDFGLTTTPQLHYYGNHRMMQCTSSMRSSNPKM